MSYQVLARKWRPGKFSELVGQEHVVTAIANALDNDRLHHAYLFTGTRGVGKTTIARIFSKSLNCETGQGANPCGVCDTCREIEQGNYVDLLEIDAASRTKVEDTRELLDNVQYKPTRGRYKVYLIDEVHMLSKHSFNALLKTLEEPPPHVKFLLATTDPQKLPITILSRCLQFNLKALSREQISGQLDHILQQEQIGFEPAALALLARAAQGSMRDALSLTDQAIAQGDNQVSASVVTDMLGLMDRHQVLKLLFALVKKDAAELLDIVAQMAEQAPDFGQVLAELSSLLHQIALTQWVPDACKLETTSAKAIYQLAKAMPAEQVQLFYQIALQGKKDLPYAVDGRSALEMTLLRMMSFAPVPPNDGNLELIVEGDGAQLTPVNSTQVAPASPVTQASTAMRNSAEPEPELESKSEPEGSIVTSSSAPEDSLQSETPSVNAAESTKEPEATTSEDVADDELSVASLEAEQQDIEQMANKLRQSAETVAPKPQPQMVPENESEPQQQPHPSQPQEESQAGAQPAPAPAQSFDQSFEHADNAPPQWDNIPTSHYDDMPVQDYDDEAYIDDYPLPDNQHGAAQVSAPVDNTASLTSIEEMLALRQKLKNGRKEADESPAKKQQADKADTSERVRRLSQRGGQQSVTSSDANAPEQSEGGQPSSHELNQQPVLQSEIQPPVAEEPPPWATDEIPAQPSSMDEQGHTETPADALEPADNAASMPVAEVDSSIENALPTESEQSESDSDEKQPSVPEQTSEPVKTAVQNVDKDALPAYLPDGTKLLLGRQVDSWSERVASLGLVGLTKQIVLNSAFSQNGEQVTLELDQSQSHLINDNAIAQLTDALSSALGQPVNVEIVYGHPQQTPLSLQARIDTMRQAYAHEVVRNDEKFTTLRDVFAASVLEDTVQPR